MQLAFTLARKDIASEVIHLVRSVGPSPAEEGSTEPALESDLVADLGFDSIRTLELVASLEDRFDINIPLNDLGSVRTVRQIVDRVTGAIEVRA